MAFFVAVSGMQFEYVLFVCIVYVVVVVVDTPFEMINIAYTQLQTTATRINWVFWFTTITFWLVVNRLQSA